MLPKYAYILFGVPYTVCSFGWVLAIFCWVFHSGPGKIPWKEEQVVPGLIVVFFVFHLWPEPANLGFYNLLYLYKCEFKIQSISSHRTSFTEGWIGGLYLKQFAIIIASIVWKWAMERRAIVGDG